MRYVAIDLGERRTGVAAGDDETGVAGPLCTLEAERANGLLPQVVGIVEKHAPDAIVVGLPLNMDGTEGEAARAVRAFGAQLHEATGRAVHYQDERLTSYAADQQMARSGHTHKQKKRRRDALAAAQILREFLDERGGR